jgi:manganese/zinc/iron transport system permease protein
MIMLTGALVGASCALLGCFLVLRKIAMLGDAISHAILPGIGLAFLLTASRASWPMFVGAVAIGVLTAFFVQFLSTRGIQGDAAIGVTFTSLFAVGVVLISLYGHHVDLDLDCVLYGEIAYTPFDTWMLGGRDIGPRAVWINGGLLLMNALAIGLLFKQFKLCAFDAEMAAAVGIPVVLMHYLLMGLVAVTAVGAFESVGAILVVAMIVVPAATAYLLTDRLGRMIAISVVLGVASSILGYHVARVLDSSIAAAMASVSGAFFTLAFFFSPNQGMVARAWVRHRLRRLVAEEDILMWLGRRGERVLADGVTAKEVIGAGSGTRVAAVTERLVRTGYLAHRGDRYFLTEKGSGRALDLLRRHRLYESFLGELGYPPDHIHDPADRVEHYIEPGVTEAVEQAARFPTRDPHDRPIPPPGEEGSGGSVP